MDIKGEHFDPESTVIEYRSVIAARDAQTSPEGIAEYDRIACAARIAWKHWQGKDSLHEMAFGEPE